MRRTLATMFMFCSGYAYACEPNEVDVTLALVADQINAAPWVAERLVMDVSADGQDNVTGAVATVRDKITTGTKENNWRQITVNGLIIHNNAPQYDMTKDDFSKWFRHNVVGGLGHFSIEIKGVNQIPEAVRRKLVLEIS